jgi:hypothetical protein
MSNPNPLLNVTCATFPTLEQIKELLGITGSAQDAALTASVQATVAMIESYLGRGIALRTGVQRFEPIDTRDSKLFLTRFPVSAIASVAIEDGGELLTGWRVYGDQGVLDLGRCAGRSPHDCCAQGPVILVTYTGGYPNDCWPPSLLDAVMSTFYRRWNATAGDASGVVAGGAVKSWSADGLSISMGDASAGLGSISSDTIPPDLLPVAAQLDPYRVRYVKGV